MNILYINHYAGSLSMGMEFRPFYMAREWQRMGHKVRILGADYSHLRKIQPIVDSDFQKETIDYIEYQWIKAGKYNGNGIKRAFSMFRFVCKIWIHANKLSRDFNPDVVITSSTYPLDSYAGYHISKVSKALYIHEAHDVWPLTLTELGGISKYNPFIFILNIAERHAYKKCNKVVSILPNVLQHMIEQGLRSESKFFYIPNGIAVQDWDNTEAINNECSKLFSELKKENKFIILYLGGHALSNALDQLLDSAKIVSDNTLAFVLVGDGVEKNRLITRTQKENIENVFFLSSVSKKQVPSVLKEADALYIGAEHCSLYRFGVSMNKLYDYMMSGKPILNGVVASNNEVEEAKCGLSFDSDSPTELIKSIKQLKKMDYKERERLGINGKKWVVVNRNYQYLAKLFLEVMEK